MWWIKSPVIKGSMNRERNIINIFMCVCLTLGLLSLVFGYLPDKLKEPSSASHASQKNLNDVVSFEALDPYDFTKPSSTAREVQGIIARFTPEPLPKLTLPQEKLPQLEPDAAPFIPESTPFTRRFRSSSLATYNPAGTSMAAPVVDRSWLDVPSGLTTEVKFWKNIYARYSTHQIVMHDALFLDIIYNVLDISDIAQNEALTPREKQKALDEALEEERDRIKMMLEKIQNQQTASQGTDEEWKIRKAFQKIDDPLKFRSAIDRVRGQKGLKDQFEVGLCRSGRFLGEIERLFEEAGLPKEITRLVFVESMFQMDAHSSAGARGIWQIMKGTAHHYSLRVNNVVDERLDPIRSTSAAIRLLKDNYEMLGTWPLAINAYNAGRGRLKGAVNLLGTQDISTIIKKFEHPSYGFASRNFFPSFLAASQIIDEVTQHFNALHYDQPIAFDELQLEVSLSLPEVARASGISILQLEELNPMLQKAAFTGTEKIPLGTTIRIPLGKGNRFASAMRNVIRS